MTTGSEPSQAPEVKSRSGHSLKTRLLWFVLVAILLAAVLQAVTAYRGALRQADAMFDDHLQQVARSLRSGIPLDSALLQDGEAPGFDLYIQIWGPDGRQLFRSTRSALPPRAVLGFSDVEADGNLYRVYTLQTVLQTVQIAQDLGARTARARALAVQAIWPFGLLTPLLMLVVWWVITRSLAPVERARREVASRAADDFSLLDNTGLPDEVRPLVDEINLLFGRVQGAFEAQQNFVADAAHELRSPLTAIKLQAQALRPQARVDETPAERDAAIIRLNHGIDRTIRLVEQLMVLAREEAGSDQPSLPGVSIGLNEVVKLAMADVLPHAHLKQIDLGVLNMDASASPHVNGQPEALRVLLRNLLDNAVKYTPSGGRVDVSLERAQGRPVLKVEDSGPGIAAQDRERVFDRFYRSSGAAFETGSGLGLSIVRVIAAAHGATLNLDRSARLGGLQVSVLFPSAPVSI